MGWGWRHAHSHTSQVLIRLAAGYAQAPGKALKFEIWEGGLRHYEGVAAEAEGYGEQRPMG